MKQAILITAYTQLDFLKEIIGCFDNDFDFFIHIDKKSNTEGLQLEAFPNVRVYSKFRIEWGSVQHLNAILFLMAEAHNSGPGYSYYHLITGSDFPIKPLSEFKSFFSKDNSNNYLEWFKLPRPTWVMEGGIERVRYYWLGNSLFDIRGPIKWFVNKSLKVQRKLGIRRQFLSLFPSLYGGGGYWSLTSDAIGYLLDTIGQKRIMRYLKHTHCAEEILFQTLLLNSGSGLPIINNTLRYSKWDDKAKSPKYLEESDLDEILSSGCFFARKFRNDGLTNLIKSNIG